MDNILKRLGIWVPIVMMIVSVDQWSAATGEADPFKVYGFSVTSAARGIGLVLAASFVLYHVREHWRKKSLGGLKTWLAILFAVILLTEVAVIAPYLIASMRQTITAQLFLNWKPFDVALGAFLYVVWCVFISLIPLVAVGAAALATVFDGDAAQSAKPTAQKSVDDSQSGFICESCGAVFGKQQSYAAHKRHCARNGHAQERVTSVEDLPSAG